MRKGVLSVCLLAALLCMAAGPVNAELLNLSLEHYPRVLAQDTAVVYDPAGGGGGGGGAGLLTADGWSWDLYEDATQTTTPIDGPDAIFDLDVLIDPDTKLAISGTLLVTGYPGMDLENLFYSTNLKSFGYGGDDILEFVFEQDGDMLAPDKEPVGVILFGNGIPDDLFSQANPPTFAEYFANVDLGDPFAIPPGQGNIFYLPEPSAFVIVAIGVLVTVSRRRRRR